VYGTGRVHHIPTFSLAEGMDGFNRQDVQVIYVDDAYACAGSRRTQSSERVDTSIDYNLIRHNFRGVKGEDRGVIIVVWGIQRYMGLDPNFRNSQITDWKGHSESPGDMEAEADSIRNEPLVKWLSRLAIRINQTGDESLKCNSVCVIPGTDKHAGILELPAVPPFLEWPSVLDDTKIFVFDAEKTIAVLEKSKEWKLASELYRHNKINHHPIKTFPVPEKYAKDKTRIAWHTEASRQLDRLNGEITRIHGHRFEQYVVDQYEKMHRRPRLGGGQSEPDVYLEDPQGFVECKLMDCSRGRFLSVQEDLAPSAREAIKAGLTHFHLWVGDTAHSGHPLQPKKVPVNAHGVRIAKNGGITIVR
jgi:hypothetical protein